MIYSFDTRMAPTNLKWLILLLCFVRARCDDAYFVLNAYPCENSKSAIPFNLSLYDINDAGDKAADVEFKLDGTSSELWSVDATIEKWNDGAWDEDSYCFKDNICLVIKQFIPQSWTQFRNKCEPPITEQCTVRAGYYKATGFEVSRTDVDAGIVEGRYKVTARIKNEFSVEMFCYVFELES